MKLVNDMALMKVHFDECDYENLAVGGELASLVDTAFKNRVIPQLYNSLNKLNIKDQELSNRYENFIDKTECLYNTIKKTQKETKFFDEALIVKGVYLNELYPQNSRRFIRDVDILVPNTTHYLNNIGNLHDLDFRLELSTWMMRSEKTNEIIGAGEWVYKPIDQHVINFDFHFGEYVYRNQYLDISYDLQSYDFKTLGRLNVLKSEENITFLIAHVFSHARIMMRDINDLYIIIKTYSKEIDWNTLFNQLKSNALLDVAAILFTLTSKFYHDLENHLPKEFGVSMFDKRSERYCLDNIDRLPHFLSKSYCTKTLYKYQRERMGPLLSSLTTLKKTMTLEYLFFLKKYIRWGKFENMALFSNKMFKFNETNLRKYKTTMFVSCVELGFEDLCKYDCLSTVISNKENFKECTEVDENLYYINSDGNMRLLITRDDVYIPVKYTVFTEDDIDNIDTFITEYIYKSA